jgi:hypothetical protein
MFFIVLDYVPNRVSRFRERAELVRVVTVREHCSAAVHHGIQTARHPHREALQSARELNLVNRFYDEVEMISEDSKMDHAKPSIVSRASERGRNRAEAPSAPQIPHVQQHPPGDVDRMMRRQRRSLRMRDTRQRALRFSSGAWPRSAPRP